jgi:hypothetical protein
MTALNPRRPLFKAAALLAFGTLTSACGSGFHFRFGSRPMPLPPAHKAEACYHDGRIEVAGGIATKTYKQIVGEDWFAEYYVYKKEKKAGLAFYKGGRRISAVQVLALLRDQALQETYNGRLDRLRRQSRISAAWGWTGFALMMGGMGVGLGSLGFRNTDAGVDEDSETPEFWAMLGAGVGSMLLGLFLILEMTGCEDPDCHKVEVYKQLFIDDALLKRLTYGLLAHNQRVARRCGYQGEVDVPVPDYVKGKQPEAPAAPANTPPPTPSPPNETSTQGKPLDVP